MGYDDEMPEDPEEVLVPLGEQLDVLDRERQQLERKARKAVATVAATKRGTHLDTRRRTAVDWRELLAVDQRGGLRGSTGNVLQILENDDDIKGCLQRDVFAGTYQWARKPPWPCRGPFPRELRDGDIIDLTRWLEQAHGCFAGPQTVGQVAANVAEKNEVDALRVWLEGLVWDGRPRIASWLPSCCGTEDTPYARAVGMRFVLAMAARGIYPGCKADTMLVLEGAQGKKKSTALRALAGDPWYGDTVPIHVEDKDAVLQLGGKWLIEFGELDRFRRTDRSALKDFMSRLQDRVRPPYGKTPVTWPRRCCFSGTTNESAYLDDATGARRFWPARVVGEIKVHLIERYRAQIFAEAVARLRAREQTTGSPLDPVAIAGQWWLTPEEEALQVGEVSDRQLVDPWMHMLEEWAETRIYLTTDDALRKLGIGADKASKADVMRLGDVFRGLGFTERGRDRAGASREYRYRKPSPAALADSVPTLSGGGDKVGTEKPRENTDVPTGPTDPTTPPRTRTRDIISTSGRDSRDGEDSSDIAGEKWPHLGPTSKTGGDSIPEDTVTDLWGSGVKP